MRWVVVLSCASCLAPELVGLPPESDQYQSMILAVESGNTLRVSAHSLPLTSPIEAWTASHPVTFTAFFYDVPLASLADDLSDGPLVGFPGGQPIPDGDLFVNRAEDGSLTGWFPAERAALPSSLEAFRLPPRRSSCPRLTSQPIPLECDRIGEHPYDTLVLMVRGEEPGEAYVTTSRGCAFLIRGDRAIRVADPPRPYAWLSALPLGPGQYLATGDDSSLTELVLTGTTVSANVRPIVHPDRDHPGVLGGDTSGELYVASFFGALWKLDSGVWDVVIDPPIDVGSPCEDPFAECHEQRSLILEAPNDLYVSNFRDTIVHLQEGALRDEPIDRGSIPGSILSSDLVTTMMHHSRYGLLAAYGSLPAPLVQRGEDGVWRFFSSTGSESWIYAMRELGDGLLYSAERGYVGYADPHSSCENQQLAVGELHQLIDLGDGTFLTGGDPQDDFGMFSVYRIHVER